jgi:hypothetical protein
MPRESFDDWLARAEAELAKAYVGLCTTEKLKAAPAPQAEGYEA